MAETKNKTTNKKDAAKKKATAKKVITKVVDEKIEEPKKEVVEIKEPEIKEEIKLNLEELKNISEAKVNLIEEGVEVMNGDPAVLTPKEENNTKKDTNIINRAFGYLWNGQAIDY